MYSENERIELINIEDEMQRAYIDYSMSVIVGRALPDVRDGMKPGNRRILYAMRERGWTHAKAYVKCAKVVGEVIGNYHPHGDTAVYDTMVRMAQDFAMRGQLIEGQGNFGSIDGDRAAAYRYTECRLQSLAEEMLADIDKNTVDMSPNFDETLMEPTVLPSRIPNLLLNGSTGIAVGMATNIPPHNLGETPIREMYETGRGKIKVRGKAGIAPAAQGKERIIITEIPYAVNKTTLITKLADLVRSKKLEGISDIRDESGKEGIRVVIELKRNTVPKVLLNNIYKHTMLEVTFGAIMLAIDHGKPKIMNIKEIMRAFLDHRLEVVTRRTQYELEKAEARAHILEGFKIALDNLDEIVRTIRESKDRASAATQLMKRFGLSEIQTKAILEMRLYQLTGLERDKVENEYLEVIKLINYLRDLLSSEAKIYAVIREDLLQIQDKYADARRTDIVADEGEINIEDLIADEGCVITISNTGYIKRVPVSSYRQQKRGGKGVRGMQTKDTDYVEHVFTASTHDVLLCFTQQGHLHWIRVYEIPEATRASRGKAIVNLLQIGSDEKIAAMIRVREFTDDKHLVMATERGISKRTNLMAYSNMRAGGIIGINIDKGDRLIGVRLTDGTQDIMLTTAQGKSIRFDENDLRDQGRATRGVKGITLAEGDNVNSIEVVDPQATILAVSENGYGKRTNFEEYRKQSRGGKGIITIRTTERNGLVVAAHSVKDADALMLITAAGQMIRIPINGIRTISRNTQGVRLINLAESDKLVSATPVEPEEPADDPDSEQDDTPEETV